MTLQEYRFALVWNQRELARRARLAYNTVVRVERGEPVREQVVAAIAKALSEGLGRTVTIQDIEGVVIRKL